MKVNKVRRLLAILVVVILISSLSIGCAKKEEGLGGQTTATTKSAVGTTTDTQEKPTELKMFIRERWAGVGMDNYVNQTIQEKTNTKWDIVIVPGGDLMDKLNVMLAGGDRFDIMNIPGDDAFELKLVKEGLLLPIDDYFDIAPNFYERNKNIWEAMRHSDGKIYAMNACVGASQGLDFLPIYRKDWLDKLGVSVPTTIDEYFTLAEKIANEDPDGNNIDDTFAFSGRGMLDTRNYDHIFSAYGVLGFFWHEENGQLIYSTVHPNTREALRAMNKLYKMGAIDPEFVTDNEERVKEKMIAGRYGAPCYYYSILDENNLYNYHDPFFENNPDAELVIGPVLTSELKGSDSNVGMAMLSPRGWVRTAIGSETENIEAVMRVFDWYNSEEGMMFMNYGDLGEHYDMKDGVVDSYVTEDDQKNLGITQLYLSMHFLPFGNSVAYQDAVKTAISVGTSSPAYGILIDETSQYQQDLDDYAKTQFLSIITGEIDVDEGFDDVLKEWEKRGGNEWTKAMNAEYKKKLK